jgi:hypothetical protein
VSGKESSQAEDPKTSRLAGIMAHNQLVLK